MRCGAAPVAVCGLLLVLALLGAGCGAAGDPMPPLLNIPARTTDLEAAQQAGELVVRWTMPSQTTEGFPLKDLDRVILLEKDVDGETPGGPGFESGAREVLALEQPKAGEKTNKRLPLPAAPGRRIALATRNLSHRGRAAGVSNIVVVEIAPVLGAPGNVTATMQPSAIRVDWSPVAGVTGYRVYRSAGEGSEFELLTAVEAPPLSDAGFQWNMPHAYFVRAYSKVSTGIAESADSSIARIIAKDVFPPSVPAGLRAVPSETAVELSWNLSPEPDTAGYNVYRRDPSGKVARLNSDLLTAPAFSDKTVQRQQQYAYSVSAVDDKGNESAPTAPFAVVIP